MRVIVEMEIETPDYGGKEFKEEIEKLIADINTETKLVSFAMFAKESPGWDYERDINWTDKS